MADEKPGELELDKSSKKKKMMIIIIAVVVLLGGSAGAYFFLMGDSGDSQDALNTSSNSDSGNSSSSDSAASPSSDAKLGTALYVPMPRPFRFNVPGAVRDRFVEIRVQLLVRGSQNEENAKMHIPLIESTLLAVFSRANADDLATSAGKVALKEQALSAVQQTMKEIESNETVEKVLFTGFVMQ
ncbi:flagellar basal body-associated protein FliL [Colwellia sp. E2M01]|uniref:flagellar basal body-associated protein FliL n=1 Tax=Colwellia sp. E2M01 TaxID=2841561 RepID=UPI001C09D3EA|nr:flagellar basal body-associated protein FliL [Colwellia sp. E2M01]MBU2869948.1 flagellar basal body-associated protein FliL [Colwellia sp. E2M01]